jgi:PAP2 superfamily
MKYIYLLGITSCLMYAMSCKKDQNSKFQDLEALVPFKTDTAAANWKPVLYTQPNEFLVAVPKDATSPEYLAELAETKQISSNLSSAQRDAIEYWSAGSVLRWNQIMRALVAKYSLPPAPTSDGTYPTLSADSTRTNPFYYPYFPFANPPYAARAYAYVSVAQYDALVASSFHRNKYTRKAAYQYDTGITALVPKNDISAYPCEDAVIASAAKSLLVLLFPGDTAYIAKLAEEAANYRIWAGAAVRTDVQAGQKLGAEVAAKAVARAKTDKMGTAGGNKAIVDSLANSVTAQGLTAWVSLDAPARPAMLPLFGRVTPWLFPSTALVSIRPIPPFAVGTPEFAAQLAEVKRQVDPKDREKVRLAHFWADNAGTPTPIGHWNAIAFEQIYLAKYSEVRAARAFALLNMAGMDAAISCWDTKYFYFTPRPPQVDPSIKTLTGMPNFPSYVSGHSMFSGSSAAILGHLFPSQAQSFEQMAKDASNSRLYAGLHYPMDCEAGLAAGKKVGDFAVARAKTDGAE